MRRGGQGDPILIYSFEVKPFGFVFLWLGNGKLYWALGVLLYAQPLAQAKYYMSNIELHNVSLLPLFFSLIKQSKS